MTKKEWGGERMNFGEENNNNTNNNATFQLNFIWHTYIISGWIHSNRNPIQHSRQLLLYWSFFKYLCYSKAFMLIYHERNHIVLIHSIFKRNVWACVLWFFSYFPFCLVWKLCLLYRIEKLLLCILCMNVQRPLQRYHGFPHRFPNDVLVFCLHCMNCSSHRSE